MDAARYSGGIWCLWDLALWKVEVLNSTNQFVHLQVTWKRSMVWLVTIVYASASYVRRQELWDKLSNLATNIVDPWVVLGDFNDILVDHERKGGSPNFWIRGMNGFRSMVQDCNLLDMGFQGSLFTWKHGNLFQRLDWGFLQFTWKMNFPSASVIHLPFFKSDHRMVMVQIK